MILFEKFRIALMSVFPVIVVSPLLYGQSITVSGIIAENGTKEPVPYANVMIDTTSLGISANAYGFYSIRVPSNKEVHLRFSALGYQNLVIRVMSGESLTLNINLTPKVFELDEVIIERFDHIISNGNTPIRLLAQTTKDVPALLGEKDLFKVIQLIPGIQRPTEGSAQLHVRGGGGDQNLIILDDAQLYNASHLFGFFSVFNADAIKRFDFWKSGFPARYGGRVSSVIDMQMKDGNKEEVNGEGGIGLLSSRLTLEGPLKKGKSAFLISGRRTYLDLLTVPFMPDDAKIAYRFYDANAKASFDGSANNKFFISAYLGNDKLRTAEEVRRSTSTINSRTDLGWRNATSSFRWNHIFNDRLFANTTLLYSNFQFYLEDDYNRSGDRPNSDYSEYRSAIRDYSFKTDFDYFLSNVHNLKTGALLTHHQYQPRMYVNRHSASPERQVDIDRYENVEFAVYIEDTWNPAASVEVNGGVRISGLLTSERNFLFAEPRMSASVSLLKHYRLTGSYTRSNQFVHLLSNTGVGLSTDLWVPVTSKAPPQQGDQFSIGLSRTIPTHGVTLTLESYRKYLRNILAYEDGASFLVISEGVDAFNWEDNITIGKGKAYGTELLIRKDRGSFTGWAGYTLSWTIHQFDSLNFGKPFYAKYDSRHALSLVGIYKFSPKVQLSATWVYNTGNALTVPHAFYYGNVSTSTEIRTRMVNNIFVNEIETERINRIPYHGSRNSFRAESYHRLDIAIQLHKKKKRYERYWEFGLFNAYSRRNPLYYYLETSNDPSGVGQRTQLKKKSLFPVMPSITYNIKF